MNVEDEKAVSEITIAPDGRIFVFGSSRQVLEVLDDLNLGGADLKRRIEHVRGLPADGADTASHQEDHVRCAEAAPSPREEPKHE